MTSVVHVYNDRLILDDSLLTSLSAQQGNHETVLIDNWKSEFKSSAAALNSGSKRAKGGFIVFVHQDVCLRDKSTLERIERFLDENPRVGIAGTAGMKDSRGRISDITHGRLSMRVGRFRLGEPVLVQTLDECLFVVPRPVFDKLQFDEIVWGFLHLHSVDYCLSALKAGLGVLALQLRIYHVLDGSQSMDESHYVTLKRVLMKQTEKCPWIYTSMGNWSTVYPLVLQKWLNRTRRSIVAPIWRTTRSIRHGSQGWEKWIRRWANDV